MEWKVGRDGGDGMGWKTTTTTTMLEATTDLVFT